DAAAVGRRIVERQRGRTAFWTHRSGPGGDRRGRRRAHHVVHESGRLGRSAAGVSLLPRRRHRQALSGQSARAPSRRSPRDGRRRDGPRVRPSRAPSPARLAMKAGILAVGSEMLTPFKVDTNSLAITDRLNAIGYDVRVKAVVGDDLSELSNVVERMLEWADLTVITGGLGPTEDDLTREAVA